MAQFEPQRGEIEKEEAQLVYIAAEKRDGFFKPVKFLQLHPVSFPFLLDEDRSVTKAYGLYHAMAHDAFHIAHPATLIADQEGMLRYIYRGINQLDRAPVDEVICAVRRARI